MAEYIDKEQIKYSVKQYFKHLIDKGKYKIDVLDANADIHKIISELPAIERLPAADVVEVKHGYWGKSFDNGAQMHECSVCGARVVKGVYEYENPNKYCYRCGAKMDRERKVENGKEI